jgi:hypothetical protein
LTRLVACLMPVNADEADLAAHYVATNACAMDCLRLAQEHRGGMSGTVMAGLKNKPGHDGASAVVSRNGESCQTTPDRLADRDMRRR